MNKTPIMALFGGFIAVIVLYFTTYKPLKTAIGPRSLRQIIADRIRIMKVGWNGEKWADFQALDDETYWRVVTIAQLYDEGIVQFSDLTPDTQDFIAVTKTNIENDPNWLESIESQVPEKFPNLEQALLMNAFYVAQIQGIVDIVDV